MKKLTTLTALAGVALIGSSQAAITVISQETFNDNALPAGYAAIGTGAPTFSNGQLVLNGTNGITLAATPLTATDNFGIEAIVTATSINGFDFVLANSTGAGNTGYGILGQNGEWFGIHMGQALFGNTAFAANTEVRLALVREAGLSTFYVNGVAAGTFVTAPIAPTQFNIGYNPADNDSSGFNGSINEVRTFTFTAGQFDANTNLLTAPTPEPSSTALLGLGGLALILRRRK